VPGLAAVVGLGLQPLSNQRWPRRCPHGASALLRGPWFSRHHPGGGADSSSHAAYYTFASINLGRHPAYGGLTIAVHDGCWGARRDRGVRAVAAIYAVAGGAGDDRRVRAPWRAGVITAQEPSDGGAGGGATGARADLRIDADRHHGIAGAPRARPCDGEGARLSRRLRRHRYSSASILSGAIYAGTGRAFTTSWPRWRCQRHCDVAGASPAGRSTPERASGG